MILIIDDEEALARIYARTLENNGFTVEYVCSGRNGLSILGRRSPELLILDITLEDMDGFEFIREARAMGYSGPVIALSGKIVQEDVASMAPGQFNITILKPIRLNELVEIVAQFVKPGPISTPAD